MDNLLNALQVYKDENISNNEKLDQKTVNDYIKETSENE